MSTTTLSNPKTNGGSRTAPANGDGRRRPRRTPKGRQVDPPALAEVRALLGDAPRRRDLLIEHLHLIQDRYGHLSAAHLAALAAEMKLALDRGLRGRDLLRAFRRGEGRRDAAAAGHGAGVRLAVLRDARRRASAARSSGKLGRERARRARALHGRLRSRAGLRGRPLQVFNATPDKVASTAKAPPHPHAFATPNDLARYRADGGYALLGDCLSRQAHARRPDQDRQRCRPARPWRRRISDRPQMVARARRTGAAHVGGQLRRRRAGHVQGPALSRAGSAPLHRRHADRRLGGRGARHLHLSARRISRGAAAAGARNSRRSKRPVSPSTRGCICAAAPAPISAAKNPR